VVDPLGTTVTVGQINRLSEGKEELRKTHTLCIKHSGEVNNFYHFYWWDVSQHVQFSDISKGQILNTYEFLRRSLKNANVYCLVHNI
jgi:hypothetical protein